jgi:DNA-binding NarL/FixJ family response regulator
MAIQKKFRNISVVIADDHEIFRDGFRAMLNKYPEMKLVGEAENGKELIAIVEKLNPDVIFTDIRMPVMDGIEATKQLLRNNPEVKIVALSMFDEDTLIMEMLEAGAKGYMLKNSHKDEIIEAIHHVSKGDNYYCKHTSEKLLSLIAKSSFNPYKKNNKLQFSEREIQIIKLICEQYANKEIAAMLNLSVRTIEGYREKIQEKAKARNSAGIVIFAIKNQIHKI